MPNNQIARRAKNNSSKTIASTIGAAVLREYVGSRGEAWVIQQVQSGALFLNAQARSWWAARTQAVSSTNMQAVQAPASVGVAVRGNARLNGSTRIKHRELIGQIAAGQTYARVSPADTSTFPYLSTIAMMYDEYKFHSVKFVLVSSLSTSAGGRWYMAWDPDSSDATPIGTQTIMAMQHSVSMSAWQSGELQIPPSQKRYLSSFRDELKDHGALTVNVPGTCDLYVEYDVSLTNPNVTGVSDTTKVGAHQLIGSGLANARFGPDYIRPANPPAPGAFEVAAGQFMGVFYLSDVTLSAGLITPLDGGSAAGSFRIVTSGNKSVVFFGITSSRGGRMSFSITGTPLANRCHLSVTPLNIVAYNDYIDSLS